MTTCSADEAPPLIRASAIRQESSTQFRCNAIAQARPAGTADFTNNLFVAVAGPGAPEITVSFRT